eukprot:scaffold145147_cov35-Attheya_sp.AAC.1
MGHPECVGRCAAMDGKQETNERNTETRGHRVHDTFVLPRYIRLDQYNSSKEFLDSHSDTVTNGKWHDKHEYIDHSFIASRWVDTTIQTFNTPRKRQARFIGSLASASDHAI